MIYNEKILELRDILSLEIESFIEKNNHLTKEDKRHIFLMIINNVIIRIFHKNSESVDASDLCTLCEDVYNLCMNYAIKHKVLS